MCVPDTKEVIPELRAWSSFDDDDNVVVVVVFMR